MVGKYGNNLGQACISPDYILVEEHLAPKLVHVSPLSTSFLKMLRRFLFRLPILKYMVTEVDSLSLG